MKVLLRIKNRFTISVSLLEEFQLAIGFMFTYPTETYPWAITVYFLPFQFEWVGVLKPSHENARMYIGVRPDSEDPESYPHDEWDV